MKKILLKNKYLIILSGVLGLYLFLNIIFFRLNYHPFSDFVANFLTYPDTFKKLIYLPTDNYLHQMPFYYLILKLFGYIPRTISIIYFVPRPLFLFFFIFIYIFALPLLIACLITHLRQKNKISASLTAIILIVSAIILSLIGRDLLNKSSYFLIYSSGANFATLDGLSRNFKVFIEAFLKLFNAFFFGEDITAKRTILHLANFTLISLGIYGLYLFLKKELAKNN